MGLLVLYGFLTFVILCASVAFAAMDEPGIAIGGGVAIVVMIVLMASAIDRLATTSTP